LIAIRAAGGQEQLDIGTVCPKCQNEATYGINLVAILSQLKHGDYDTVLPVNDLKIKFRALTYKEMNQAALEQFNIQKTFGNIDAIENVEEKQKVTQEAIRAITEATMKIISTTIEYIDTPNSRVEQKEFIDDFLHNCDGSVYLAIRDHNTALKNSTDLKPLDITCDSCSHQYQQPYTLNASDFFG
jgi:rRNA maturation endonuclease Nob1